MSTGIPTREITNELLKNRRAVIDIGSNSVRLVIYGGPIRTPLALFNEKVLCGLGTPDRETGGLRREAMDNTISVLSRFGMILENAGKIPLIVFATAAIRDAPNGSAFIKEVEDLGFEPSVLSGEEEARFAALGVLSATIEAVEPQSASRPNLCGDMGGGSLELARFSDNFETPFLDRISLPLGPLTLISRFGRHVSDSTGYVTDQLASQNWLAEEKTGNLYAVGGAWRAIAKVHMAKVEYPLPILHHYEIPRDEMISICDLLQKQSAASLELMPGVQRKRIDTLPHAAMVLSQVLQHTRTRRVVISSSGVREGMLFDLLSKQEREADPVLILAREYANRYSPNPAFGDVVFDLTASLFADETREERRIRHAACIMCDLALMHHPDMRAQHASDVILHSPLIGIDHASRVTISAALYLRHRSKITPWPAHIPKQLMSDRLLRLATTLGFAMRFVSDFSSSTPALIRDCTFDLKKDVLTFRGPAGLARLMSDTPQKRLTALAAQLGTKEAVEFSDI